MSYSPYHYSEAELKTALEKVGVQNGSTIFVHASLGRLGYSDRGRKMEDSCQCLLNALRSAVGDSGTILVPVYSYSIGRNEVFDVQNTPSAIGDFTEFFRKRPGVARSADPMLSVAGLGPLTADLLSGLPRTCYGRGSLYDRIHDADARIVTVGLGLYWATYRHYIEEWVGVPFRFSKLFTGVIRDHGIERKETWTYFAAPRISNCEPDGIPLEKMAKEAGLCRSAAIGRGEVCAISARDYRTFAAEQLLTNPWLSAKGPALSLRELIEAEDRRVGATNVTVNLDPSSTMMSVIDEITPLRRDILSSGFDSALEALGRTIPMTIHEYPSGTPCFTWIVPEKWTCREGWVETLSGTRLIDYNDSPLHIVSYSEAFEGEVTRQELLDHLETHPYVPAAIPFSYSYFHRRWGLCCSQNLRDSLDEERYRVCIKAERSFGTLKVGEVIVPGERESGFVLCAHLDHPGQANDGLSGVAVGIEVMKRLLSGPPPRHTVRFLIVSETFGSLAWLSSHLNLVPGLRAGLFLEMLGLKFPHALQHSQSENTIWDLKATEVMTKKDAAAWTGKYLKVVTNDDRQFNAPGIRVPMLSLSRVKEPCGTGEGWPFDEYHSSFDSAKLVSEDALAGSVDLTLAILAEWDKQTVPLPLYQAEPCLTRFGVSFDFTSNPSLASQLFDVMHTIDGRVSLEEISAATGMQQPLLMQVVDKLQSAGLVKV